MTTIPKLSKRANTRIEWCLEVEDGSYEDYLVDAHVQPGNNPYYSNSLEKDVPGYGTEIDIIDIYEVKNGEYETVHVTTFLNSLSDKQSSSLDYLLEQEYNDNMEMLEYEQDDWAEEDEPEYDEEEAYYDPSDLGDVDDIVRQYRDDY